jgi:iron complex outermembrane receptor protein
MHNLVTRAALLLGATSSAALLAGAPARAQQQGEYATRSRSEVQEVIVTARKREESILYVPVVETALPQVTLERLQVNDLRVM